MKVYDMFGAMPARKQRRMDEGLLSNPRGLSGMLDDYNQNVSDFKTTLAKISQAAREKEAQERAGQETYHAPQTPQYQEPEPPPTPQEPESGGAKDFTPEREGALGPEMNLPGQMGPIAVYGGDEVPPPVPVPPKTPGGHAPVVTGIPDWADRWYPTQPIVIPGNDTSVCKPGYTRTEPGGPCLKDTPSEDTAGFGCYTCGGDLVWTDTPSARCYATGYDRETCKKSGGGTASLPNIPGGLTAPAIPSITAPFDTGGYTSFAGGSMMSGVKRLQRLDGMGAPAFSRPIKVVRRPW